MRRATLQDHARLKEFGFRVERYGNGWCLLDPDGAALMIASYGCMAPTQWEAVAEGLERIAIDERNPSPIPTKVYAK